MNKWIKSENQLPPDGVYVLCCDEDVNKCTPCVDDLYFAAWDKNQKFFPTDYWGDHDFMCVVTPNYWAYLPEGD